MIKSYLYYASEYVYKKILPGALKIFLMRFINPGWHTLRADIVRHLENELRTAPDAEKEVVLEILRKNPVYFIPYEHDHVFPIYSIRVFRDGKGGKYVLHDGKRLFFPEDWDDFRIQTSYCALLREQNPRSPHRYETDSFGVRNGDIIVDCGAAEGIWALSSVEKAGKVYLVECDEKWIAALRKTFEPWKEKVEIAGKFVSDTSSDGCVTLDDLLGGGGGKFYKSGHRRSGNFNVARRGKNAGTERRFTTVAVRLSSAKRRARFEGATRNVRVFGGILRRLYAADFWRKSVRAALPAPGCRTRRPPAALC